MRESITPERIKKIKIVVTDVDGVLTDGGLFYTSEGMVMKKFNVKDGMGVRRLRASGIKCGIISTDTSEIIIKRAERSQMDFVFTGIWEKGEKLKEFCESESVSLSETAFIGDDVNDLGIIDIAGFTACPSDAEDVIKEKVDYICKRSGGKGVFREFAELILSHKDDKGNFLK